MNYKDLKFIILITGSIFLYNTQLNGIIKPKKRVENSLRSYMTLTIPREDLYSDVISKDRILKKHLKKSRSGSKRIFSKVYNSNVGIELGKTIYFKSPEGYTISIFTKLSDKNPTQYLSMRYNVSKKDGPFEQTVMQSRVVLPYKTIKQGKKYFYQLSRPFKKIKKDKFGKIKCILKLVAFR